MNKEEKINVAFKLEDIPMIIDTMEKFQQENKQLKEIIDKAIDILYTWGEVLNADFQKQMLNILKGEFIDMTHRNTELLEENKEFEILNETTDFCKNCLSNNNCSEEECVIYRIEKIINRRD